MNAATGYATGGLARHPDRWLAAGLLALAVALTVNSLLGPFVLGVVTYPFSETLYNQTVGLEAVSLLVVAPWSAVAAWAVARGHRAGPVLAIPPAAYTAYMFLQYIVGPQYLTYAGVVPFHLGLFVLAGAMLVRAWNDLRVEDLPSTTERTRRRAALGLALLAAFVCFRYLPAVEGFLTDGPLSAEAAEDPTMYWSIFFLDLGVVVPVTVATTVGLLRDEPWARKALYGVAGWFLFVPTSVAAMGLAMLLAGDPNAALGQVVVLSAAALLFAGFVAWLYWPLVSAAAARGVRTGHARG